MLCAWVFLLTIGNSVQAIRSRHLPECFKETRVMMLSNILSCIISGNTVWLAFFQKRKTDQSIFLFYAILLLNGINFYTLYGYKLFILLFAPEKNTKQHFNLVVRKKVAKQQAITLSQSYQAREEENTEL